MSIWHMYRARKSLQRAREIVEEIWVTDGTADIASNTYCTLDAAIAILEQRLADKGQTEAKTAHGGETS